jgi:hypothetical protein
MDKFSERESKILKILGYRQMTIEKIVAEVFENDAPLDAEIAVGNSIKRIMKKCEHYDLPWTLTKIRGERKLRVCRISRMTTKVYLHVRKKTDRNNTKVYKYRYKGADYSPYEIEQFEKIDFIFAKSMTNEDKIKIINKWLHKF